MAIRIEATLEGEKQVSAYLGVVATGVKDFRAPLQKISSEMLKTFDLNYSSAAHSLAVGLPGARASPGRYWRSPAGCAVHSRTRSALTP